jgi:hypothetical protein
MLFSGCHKTMPAKGQAQSSLVFYKDFVMGHMGA